MPTLDPDPSEFDARRRRVAGELEKLKLDALIVPFGPNVRYLTGFTGSHGVVLLTGGGTVLFTDPRYQFQASREAVCRVKVATGPLLPQLLKLAGRRKLRRLGFERGRLTYADYELLKDKLYLGASLEPVSGLVETQRMVKSPREIELIRGSVETACRAFDRAMRKVRPGLREQEVAAEIDYQMRLLGASGPAFETIVAAGERTALPHARPTANRISANQLLLVDMGATQDGYTSDLTRMSFLGKPPGRIRRLYEAVREAQLAGLDAVRAGATAAAVDRAARRVLGAKNLDKAFMHSTGHGLGLEIHEPPRLGKREKTRLAAGMVVTVEPGAYLEGFGGVRIEDTVVVTANGCEVLTPIPKELLLL